MVRPWKESELRALSPGSAGSRVGSHATPPEKLCRVASSGIRYDSDYLHYRCQSDNRYNRSPSRCRKYWYIFMIRYGLRRMRSANLAESLIRQQGHVVQRRVQTRSRFVSIPCHFHCSDTTVSILEGTANVLRMSEICIRCAIDHASHPWV